MVKDQLNSPQRDKELNNVFDDTTDKFNNLSLEESDDIPVFSSQMAEERKAAHPIVDLQEDESFAASFSAQLYQLPPEGQFYKTVSTGPSTYISSNQNDFDRDTDIDSMHFYEDLHQIRTDSNEVRTRIHCNLHDKKIRLEIKPLKTVHKLLANLSVLYQEERKKPFDRVLGQV